MKQIIRDFFTILVIALIAMAVRDALGFDRAKRHTNEAKTTACYAACYDKCRLFGFSCGN